MSDRSAVPRRPTVWAAGGVLWRPGPAGEPEIALVHRPRYDDWSLPKGKAKAGEHVLVTALREVAEETGHHPVLGPFIGRYSYPVTSANGTVSRKSVGYWAMRSAGEGDLADLDEVDDVCWLSLGSANARVTRVLDRTVLSRFVASVTSPIVVLRHAATTRAASRPLAARGRSQAMALVPVLAGLGVARVLGAPPPACRQTLEPYAEQAGLHVEPTGPALQGVLLGLAAQGIAAAACLPQPDVAPLVEAVAARAGSVVSAGRALREAGWWLLHLDGARLVSVERHDPPPPLVT